MGRESESPAMGKEISAMDPTTSTYMHWTTNYPHI